MTTLSIHGITDITSDIPEKLSTGTYTTRILIRTVDHGVIELSLFAQHDKQDLFIHQN